MTMDDQQPDLHGMLAEITDLMERL